MKKQFSILVLAFLLVLSVNSQEENAGIPLLGEVAPSFTAETTQGKLKFPKDYGSHWKILFSHPKDYTPVCSSELLELAYQQDDYDKLGVKVVVLSTDVMSQHLSWIQSLEEVSYRNRASVKIKYPLVDDSDYTISSKYGMVHPHADKSLNIRAVYIIDPQNKIRSINFYPNEVGRNMEEIKRTVIALQTVDANKNDVAPANWQPGDYLMVPSLTRIEEENVGAPDSDIERVTWFMNFRKNK